MNQDANSLLDQGDAVCHVDVIFLALLPQETDAGVLLLDFSQADEIGVFELLVVETLFEGLGLFPLVFFLYA
jgi:hypothetical protein